MSFQRKKKSDDSHEYATEPKKLCMDIDFLNESPNSKSTSDDSESDELSNDSDNQEANSNLHDTDSEKESDNTTSSVTPHVSESSNTQYSYSSDTTTPTQSWFSSESQSESSASNFTCKHNSSHVIPTNTEIESENKYNVLENQYSTRAVTVEEIFGNIDDIYTTDEDVDDEYYTSSIYSTTDNETDEDEEQSTYQYKMLQRIADRQSQRLSTHAQKVDREAFVMKIMKTFKCNSLYDTFCYTLPRSEEALNGYKRTVSGILMLSEQCKFGFVESTIENFPSVQSFDFAEGIVEDMRKRYKEMLGYSNETNHNSRHSSDNSLSNTLEKEVDNDLPHCTVFMVSDGINDVVSTWSGQFQVCINPVTYTLSLRMFDFQPSFSEDTRQALCRKELTEEICKEIIFQMERFECSRQLKMDVDFKGFNGISFFRRSENEGLLFTRIKNPATFYQRLVNSSARDRNEWHLRDTFLPFTHGCYRDYVLILGGVVSELSKIAALITIACPDVKIVNMDISEFMLHHISTDCVWKTGIVCFNKPPEKSVEISISRRNGIIDILTKCGLLSETKGEELMVNVRVTEANVRKGSVCNCLCDLQFHPCFQDYIDYRCMDISELEHQLSRRCTIPGKLNGCESIDYNPETQNTTVAKYLITNTDSKTYFSFCNAEIATRQMWHCYICGKCNQENEWHCPKCDKCTRRQLVCENCGFAGYSFIIKPGSVDEFVIPKPEWNIQLATNDVPEWSKSVEPVPGNDGFNMEDFMRDELGLIDPMAFLLGIDARGGGNRKGRNRNKYEKKVEGNPKMLAAAGCCLQ